MIRFNRKPGFFLTMPQGGKRHLKAIVDITYDSKDHALLVHPLVKSYEQLFASGPIGPDDKPMVLGTFALEGPVIKANVPDANGRVFTEAALKGAVEEYNTRQQKDEWCKKHDRCRGHRSCQMWYAKLGRFTKRFGTYFAGFSALLAITLFMVLVAWLGE